jgi:hypothetical protein
MNTDMKNNHARKIRYLSLLGLFLTAHAMPVKSETITIGKGSGVAWEGLPFDVTLSGPLIDSFLQPGYGLAAISNVSHQCIGDYNLVTYNGMKVMQIAPGVGLVPRATAMASYTFDHNGQIETLAGTIGLPKTEADVIAGKETIKITNPLPYGLEGWCLAPRMARVDNFYRPSAPRTVTIKGTWVLVTNGNQTSSEIKLDPMWAVSFSSAGNGNKNAVILPSTIDLRISNLECNVATPTAINFGAVQRNISKDAELAKMSNHFNVNCTQDTDRINANIGVQFRAKSGLYDALPSQLSLQQGGGYITGEISGVTTDGMCGGTGGITFDRTKIKLGEIKDTEASKAFPNQIIWRLCSGGLDLPSGPVNASAEMLVTYN